MAYAFDRPRRRVLLIYKDATGDQRTFSKYNGIGGKIEPGEHVVAGMKREFWEETGLTAERYALRGTVSWPGFWANGESWFGFIFRIDAWSGDLRRQSAEGQVGWYDLDQLLNFELPMWPGDRYFLPLVFDSDVAAFHGVLPYENGQPVGWEVEIVPAQ
ncbi:MAG: 8-oxo-dGTP diphosphatase [Propionibacteriaceae bacterium]|nr:8-oxo-dGTP diphosphatase [Propionibacteriaceae bacterium]